MKTIVYVAIIFFLSMEISENNRLNKKMEDLFPDFVPQEYRSSNWGLVFVIILVSYYLLGDIIQWISGLISH